MLLRIVANAAVMMLGTVHHHRLRPVNARWPRATCVMVPSALLR